MHVAYKYLVLITLKLNNGVILTKSRSTHTLRKTFSLVSQFSITIRLFTVLIWVISLGQLPIEICSATT